jgi:hypothetical protein
MTDTPELAPPAPAELPTLAQAFWRSVQAEQTSLNSLPLVELVNRLNDLLEAHVPGVAAEAEGASPDMQDGAARLVFTSHGSTDHFAAVQAVVAQVPQGLPWQVTAFRQRTGTGFGMRMDAFELSTQDLRVRVGQCEGRVALALSFACTVPTDMREHARHMAFILLDHMLGEYDFAVKVGLVEFEEDGLSEGLGFQNQAPVPLDEAVAAVDACWLDVLGRSGRYPVQADWATLKGRNGSGQEMQAQVNRAANALVGRADLGWRVQASVPAGTAQAQAAARAFEKAWTVAVEHLQQGICSHVVQGEGQRHVCCYASDSLQAVQAALEVARRCLASPEALELSVAYEPAWDEYLLWLERCAV